MKKASECPVQTAVSLIGGKWNILIVYFLLQGTKRFNELKKSIPLITQKMLTQSLRSLEANRIVARKIYPVIPPKVEYSLTELGTKLEPVFDKLCSWGRIYNDEMGRAQDAVKLSSPRRTAAK